MRGKTGDIFTTIRTEGALLPAEILRRIVEGDRTLEGLDPESYHLEKSEKINEAVNRAWFRCLGAWRIFRAATEKLLESDIGTTLTRERWLLILFQELGYGRLLATRAQDIGGNTYPISHIWHHTPIHLVSFRQDLDRRTPGVAGAARLSPHSLVQEFLNRSENHLWGAVSNGHRLRILRDNISLTRQAYVDFDLEALMEGEIYTDFVLLYLLLHQSRLEAEKPEECRLEKWSRVAQERGTRALDRLRDGVEQAITALGQGFLAHPENTAFRRALQAGSLSSLGYYQQLLRLIYRFIFLFVAEDRGLIPLSDIAVSVRKRYDSYSIAYLRRLAGRRRGTRHGDLYAGLRVTFACLEKGEPSLGIPALNGFLFSPENLTNLNGCKLANDALLSAIRGLCYTEENHILRPVDYRNLGTEELGSVYESLLELHPELNAEAFTFALKTFAGSERKTTGSYYTHPSLIRCLLDSALEPLLGEAMKKPDPEEALLSLKVVDPACGSGHFLIAAAHRIAKDLAVVRTGEGEPPPEILREALRDVVANCIYGVDINPLAVELCKVALWLESLDPRKPLGFLDHRIKSGNSIIGATPELLKKGIPDDAFKPVEGDDPAVASSIRRKNKEERKGQQDLFIIQEDRSDWREAASAYATWASLPEDNIGQVLEKARCYETLLDGRAIRHQHDLADLWTAAFFWPLTKETYDTVPTQDVFRRLRDGAYSLNGKTAGRVKALVDEHRFFHWHLEFPDVFMKRRGFDCVLGNPPWERIKLQEKEFFAQRDPEIANAPNAAARKRLIANLPETNTTLWKAFAAAKRMAEGESHFLRTSCRYPLSAVGDLNTYQIFAGLFRELLSGKGRAGVIVPTGIATDDTNKQFFADLTAKRALVSLYDFENRENLFPDVDSRMKFCLLTLGGPNAAPGGTDFAFFLTNAAQLHESDRHFKLSAEEIALLNPNTRTCPIFRSKRDAEITKAIYRRVPVLINESKGDAGNPWGISFLRMFDMANDSHLFRTREQLEVDGLELKGNIFEREGERYSPLYEAKMAHQFDHRWATYEGNGEDARDTTVPEKSDPHWESLPRYWVAAREIYLRIAKLPKGLLSASRDNDASLITLGMAHWMFAHWLQRESGFSFEQAVEMLFSSWKRFVARYPFASVFAPTQMGLTGNNPPCMNPLGQEYLPADPIGGISCNERESTAWYAADPMAVANYLDFMTSFPLDIPVDLQVASETEAVALAERCLEQSSPKWLMGFRDITNVTNERTVIAALISRVGVGHTAPLILSSQKSLRLAVFLANLCSVIFDFVARQKVGGTHLTYGYLRQFPALFPDTFTSADLVFIVPRVLELTYTAYEMRPFAEDVWAELYPNAAMRSTMPEPFHWDEERRFKIRCELDALYFHLYGINRDDADYILETFPIVKRKDIARYGEYRTKNLILEIYDAMQRAKEAGQPYQTILDPSPGDLQLALKQQDFGNDAHD